MEWIERKTVVHNLLDLSFDSDQKINIIDPSKVRLVIPGFTYPVDIGSWCYTKRRQKNRDTSNESISIREVSINSFRIERVSFVQKYIEYLSTHISLGKSPRSLITSVGQFQRFVNWCDINLKSALDNKENYIRAASLYSEEMIRKIRRNEININTAATLQLIILTTGKNIYNDRYNDIFREIRRIHRSQSAVVKTEVPDEIMVKRCLIIYQQIFDQLSDLALEFKKFPNRIEIENEYFWHFPISIPFAGPSTINTKKALKNKFKCYDYISGKIRPACEIKEIFNIDSSEKQRIKEIEKSIDIAKHKISASNKNRYHRRRIESATFAFQAFMMLFSANTAMNLGQIISINWDDKFEVVKDRIGFKGIKNRANGKDVTFYISSAFFPAFNKFIDLRRYILKATNVSQYPYLFFRVVNNDIRECGMNLSSDFHERIKNCFDLDVCISTRMWRAYKADWLIRNSDIATTANILQNSTATVMRHYAEGSQNSKKNEITEFFETYHLKLVSRHNAEATSTPSGSCANYNNPVNTSGLDFVSDCKTPEGCLFCENYRAHPDEKDVRKLYSFLHVLQLSRPLALNENHYEAKTTMAISAIEKVIDEIIESGSLSRSEILKIKNDVIENENLTSYWDKKLTMLEEIGVHLR